MKALRIIGFALTALAIIGFFTVADEFRHTGELYGNIGVLFAGTVLVLAGFDNSLSRRLRLYWLAIGVGIGLLLGAALNNMLLGMAIGIVIGASIMALRRKN